MSTTELQLEKETCSRCCGTGHYSYNQITGSVCFKCGGAKRTYTKRGQLALEYLIALRSKPLRDVRIGDCIRMEDALTRRRWFADVVKHETNERGFINYAVDGYGVSGENPEKLIRMACTSEQKIATLKKAIEYQNTLNKNGTPKRK